MNHLSKKYFAKTFAVSLLALLFAGMVTNPVVVAAKPSPEYIKVEVKGKLTAGVFAIGGETTGTTITAKGVTWELDFGKNAELRASARKLNGKKVIVQGQLTRRVGVEIRQRFIVTVTSLKTAAKDANKTSSTRPKPGSPRVHLMLTKGIVGGFAPPHVSLQIVILRRKEKYEVYLKEQERRNTKPAFHCGILSKEQLESLFGQADKLGLWKLPREAPVGSQDIYQMDLSINALRGKKAWRNGGPGGCVRSQSKVQANDDQRTKFKQLADAVTKLAKSQAKIVSDANTFQTAARVVQSQTPRRTVRK